MNHASLDEPLPGSPLRGVIFKRIGIIIAFLLGSGFLAYLGFTRTEIGRDYLRKELETGLTEIFDGKVTIGTVSGDIQRQVRFKDIAFYDEQESLWLRIDEITAQPDWRGIFGQRIELGSLTITHPLLFVEYTADSVWNLSSILGSRQSTTSSTWEFESTQISISGGAIIFSYQEHAPAWIQSGWLFDLANANISDISLEGNLNVQSNRQFFAIESLTASIDTLEFTADGELLFEDDLLYVNALNVSSSVNQATVVGVLSTQDKVADFSLDESFLTPEFVQAISPEILLPNSLFLNGRTYRKGAQWLLEDYIIASDYSRIEIPSAIFETGEDHVSFEASIATSTLSPSDLNAVPNIDIWSGGDVQIEGILEGKRALHEIELEGSLEILTETGSRIQVKGSSRYDKEWIYDAALTAINLNLYESTGAAALNGMMNGTISFSGKGIHSPSLSAKLALSTSTFGEQSLDSLWVEGALTDQQLNLNGFMIMQESRMETEIAADWAGDILSFESRGGLATFDFGNLFLIPELETSIHATWGLRSTGASLDALSASLEIEVDSSTIGWNDHQRMTPPTRWLIAIQDTTSPGPRLTVQSDVLDLEVSGEFRHRSLRQIGIAWVDVFSEVFDQFGNYLRADQSLANLDNLDQQDKMHKEDRITESASSSPIALNLVWQLHKHPAIDALLPMLPAFSSTNQGRIEILADEESLYMESQMQDEAFRMNGLSAYQAEVALVLDAKIDQEMESGWRVDLDLSADSLVGNRAVIRMPQILINQDGEIGNLKIFTDRDEISNQRYLSSDIQLLADRVRLQIEDVHIPIGDAIWNISQSATIDLFADAAIITPMRLETSNPFLDEVQVMTVQGNLSSLPSDTLRLSLVGVDLMHLSSILELRRSWGGQIDADLLWTGLWQPEITGTLEVDTLTFDSKLVGNLQASSILPPGGSSLRLAMMIDSLEAAPAGYQHTSNEVTVIGSITVPTPENSEILDITMDVQHLDAAFLQLLLRDFSGFHGGLNGQIKLGGTLDRLTLGGALSWENGGFEIPGFNSSYTASALVDLEGDKVFVNQLIIQDSDGGTARIEGSMDLNEFRFLSFDASADLESLQIMDVLSHTRNLAFYGDIRVSGNATLTGPIHTSFLRSDNLVVSPQSEVYIPVRETDVAHDPGFIIYVDSTQSVERQLTTFRQRENILDQRPAGERLFRDGLDMDLNLVGPEGSNIHLVIDPLLGDVINGTGTARVQIQRTGGDMTTYGSFDLSSGDYLFTAGEVFVRRFLIDSGTITWNGEPLNPVLDIQGEYRTRASRNGLPDDVGGSVQTSLPLIVNLYVSGTLNAVLVDLSLEIDQRQEVISDTPLLDSYLNRPDLATEHATSVLLTNSFLLSANGTRGGILASSAVNSVSSLVASQLNRYLSQVIPRADFSLGVQSDETVQDLDVSAGIALRLLNERLVIRGQGVYRGLNTEEVPPQGLQGEFIVEIRLNPSVAVEFFYRRESDVLSESLITRETGLGLNYRAEFTSWQRLFRRRTPESTEDNSDAP